ncbi:MAG TPA: uracil-DNA glycosylase [Rhizomicrobium sp.]|nr:uracil-DNA glycosylase [Rhizomicrobium sp.]
MTDATIVTTVPPDLIDVPKCLRDPSQRTARLALLHWPLMDPLTARVDSTRAEADERDVPYFDPLDGGTVAECLFLLEAPGPQARKSGFVSRNNPDETAKNWFELNVAAGIDRRRTILWNIVPWYIGSEGRIRPATTTDIQRGLPYLLRLIALLPALRVIVLVGKKASKARFYLQSVDCRATILEMPHPSPSFINRSKGNRDLLLHNLQRVRDTLDETDYLAAST